jgi:hypothetical protein
MSPTWNGGVFESRDTAHHTTPRFRMAPMVAFVPY